MRRALLLMLPLLAGACSGAERLSRLGDAPEMAGVVNPTADPRWRPVSMPMPNPQDPPLANNSLWRPGSRTFLRDQRAAAVGDLVTVLVAIADEAELQNHTVRSRDNSEGMGIPQMLGLQRQKILDRFAELKLEADGQRLEQELVMLAQKSDVAEELDRLNTHVGEVRRVLRSGGAAGRRLDFLMQELNREANTLGSKAYDPRSTQAAVNLKVLIEQMREQVQNIE